jgi:signal transduction histidine kinase
MSRGIVLVVSDERQTGDLLARALVCDESSVLVVEGAAQAIAVLNARRVAVLMLGWPLAQIQDIVLHAHRVQPEALIFGLRALERDEAQSDVTILENVRRVDELVLLNEVGQAMAATLDFDEVLQLLLQAVAKTVQVDECVVALWDEATQRYLPRARLLEGQSLPSELAKGDETISEFSLPSCSVLLKGRDRVLGWLALERRSDENELSTQDLQLAQALANQAASALENARLYAELKQSARELERSQRRLIQSEKLAATGRLAASIAHEINNPLQAIKNCLELLLDEAEAGEPLDRTYLDVAMNELERIQDTIQQMLDLYRPEKGRMASVDLNAAVEGVLALMRKQLESCRIGIETYLDSARPHVVGRGDQIRQVFINLILNAVEAMPEGGQLTLTTRQDSDGIVTVLVADTGVGISPENLAHIADPFFTTKPKGVGLGMSICHEIIERHQGTLDLTSQIGRGTTFTIRLPAARRAQGDERPGE